MNEIYKPNSDKYREEQKKDIPATENDVVANPPKLRKKGAIGKLGDIFISEDAHKVKNYILLDVLVPAVKKAVSDIVTNGIDMILYGESRHSSGSGGSRVSYRQYYDNRDSRSRDDRERYSARNVSYNYDDIIYETRGEAEKIMDLVNEVLSSYPSISIADYYDIYNKENDNGYIIPIKYTDNNYGWKDLDGVRPVRVRDGWVISFPKAIPLK